MVQFSVRKCRNQEFCPRQQIHAFSLETQLTAEQQAEDTSGISLLSATVLVHVMIPRTEICCFYREPLFLSVFFIEYSKFLLTGSVNGHYVFSQN